jgi:hypothetical protein
MNEIGQGLGAEVRLVLGNGLPGTCGDESEIEDLPQGGTNPYNFVTFADADDVPPGQIDTIAQRLRDYLAEKGWQITKFRPVSNGRTITDLTARNPSDGFAASIEVLHPDRRIIVSVGSPCLKHPPGDDTRLAS